MEERGMSRIHVRVQTDRAPEAIGPYSQAVAVPELGLVFTSGQIGLDPATGRLVDGGIEAEARQVMENLSGVLEAAGSGFHRVIKATVYLIDLAEFAQVNAIYAQRVGEPLPARSTVGVASLPRGARLEIDLVASLADSGTAGLTH
jgi:2-iminobutanoate/2-iminopropanoate deaminase